MIKRMLLMLAAAGVVFGGIFGFEAFRSSMIKKFMASMGSQPQTVATVKAETQVWRSQSEAVGTLKAVNGTDLALEVSGLVESVNFHSGDDVKAGAVLVRLKPDDDVAKLQSLEAGAQLADIVYQRDEKQWRAKAVSQATLDTDEANLKVAKAQVAEQRAAMDKKVLRAPFSGRLGIRAVDVGQFVNAGTAVVTLQALDPIHVDFFLPQQALSQIKVGMPVSAEVDTYPGKQFEGRITAIDPKVDASSRNLQVRATLRNPDGKLLPGMYAKVDVDTGTPSRYLTLPHTAITFNPYGETIFVIDDKGKDDKGHPRLVARQTFVTTGPARGDQVAVLKGIKEGDTVVVAGQIKLRNGTPVLINNSVRPTDDANPTVIDP